MSILLSVHILSESFSFTLQYLNNIQLFVCQHNICPFSGSKGTHFIINPNTSRRICCCCQNRFSFRYTHGNNTLHTIKKAGCRTGDRSVCQRLPFCLSWSLPVRPVHTVRSPIPVAIMESLIRTTLLSPNKRKVLRTVTGWI